jgi:hypothetical protein
MNENSLGIWTKCIASDGDNSKRVPFEAFGREDLSAMMDQNMIMNLTRFGSEVLVSLTHHADSKCMRSRSHFV